MTQKSSPCLILRPQQHLQRRHESAGTAATGVVTVAQRIPNRLKGLDLSRSRVKQERRAMYDLITINL